MDYSLKWKRCFGKNDGGAKGRMNAIGALLCKTLLTINLFKANIHTEIFTAWVKQDLLPKPPPRSVTLMNNAAFHKGAEMKRAIEKEGQTLLYLPPTSPDLPHRVQMGPGSKSQKSQSKQHPAALSMQKTITKLFGVSHIKPHPHGDFTLYRDTQFMRLPVASS
jgi:hypothetical protein